MACDQWYSRSRGRCARGGGGGSSGVVVVGGGGEGCVPAVVTWITTTSVVLCSILLSVNVISVSPAQATWMQLGVASLAGSVNPQDVKTCSDVPGLVLEQQEQCRENPERLHCVIEGARRGILECQHQFKFERWNCTTNTRSKAFGPVLKRGTKETAFIYAISSAGVVHSVTQACSAGNLTDCSCDMSRYGEADVEGWKWGGCSDNIAYGLKFAEAFVDAPETMQHEKNRPIRNLMNLHNNEVGRKTVENLMSLRCRCHGVSGSCAVKTCWRGLPPFHEVGNTLKRSYERSVRLARRLSVLKRKEKSKRGTRISKAELVYIQRSPNYCRHNAKRGILGTQGRVCNRTSTDADSCDLLCCGRGYNTQVVRYMERCHCKFHWCCYVECKTCETMIDFHTCK